MSTFALSVHRNKKIIASLCITRPPLLFTDDPVTLNFRNFRNDWLKKNHHDLRLDDSLLFMHAPKHFLPTPEEIAKSSGKAVLESEAREIDVLVATEGLKKNARRERAVKKTRVSQDSKVSEISSKAAAATEQDMNRLPEDFLHLVIKRSGIWQLPWGNRRASETIETTLMRVTADQLGFEPFFPGFSPLNFTRIPEGAKVFYYRAWVNRCKVKKNETIEDYAWLTRTEMKERLSEMSWYAIDPILPLTN